MVALPKGLATFSLRLLSVFIVPSSLFLGLLFSGSVTRVDAESIFHESEPPFAKVLTSTPLGPSFAELVKKLSPAVVNISVESKESSEDAASGPELPFFRRDKGQPARSLGSGLIVSEDGFIITNNHVIEKADKIIVRLLDDKTTYTASVRGIDQKTDLALLKIEARSNLPYAYLGDSDRVEVGDWVLAIGNQFQLGQTVTAGIVSATSRRLVGNSPYDAFIQTDASINPGSSGGPLFNVHGQVIGINTAIFSPGRSQMGGVGFNIGIGFAIPVNLVKSVISQLRDNRKVTRGMLGVLIQEINADMAEALGVEGLSGALVSDVLTGSPAAQAGFQRRDIIVKFDGKDVPDHFALPLMVAQTTIGKEVQVEVARGKNREVLKAVIGELRDNQEKQAPKKESLKPNQYGLLLEDLTEETIKSLGLKSSEGVLVQGVEPNSAAEESGFSRGDVIEELGAQRVSSISMLEQMLKSLPAGKAVLVLVRRGETTRFLTLKRER